jgi:hypothetical protein
MCKEHAGRLFWSAITKTVTFPLFKPRWVPVSAKAIFSFSIVLTISTYLIFCDINKAYIRSSWVEIILFTFANLLAIFFLPIMDLLLKW